MEISDLLHLGIEYIVSALMIHSVSPKARRLCEQMLTGDPFVPNIKLDEESTNRNVEILNAYLKTKGLRLIFNKILKKKKPFVEIGVSRNNPNRPKEPFVMFRDRNETFDIDEYYQKREECKERKQKAFVTMPFVRFDPKSDKWKKRE